MPLKRQHEFRDPIHSFIELDRQERTLVDTVPFQRLRHIHQLATTFLVYPGATHKRFEHSIGVMHLAKLVFDIVTKSENIHKSIEHIIPDGENLNYWRTVVGLAALAHDLGHIPFSHAGEKQLLPKNKDHESMTVDLLTSEYLMPVWSSGQHVQIADVKKLAVGQKRLKNTQFSTWESLLSEIIVGDSFGVDRIDYLLRDSYHAGVAYGRFDHLKLIESLRILPESINTEGSAQPQLGVELGGLHSAEALLIARYFMYEQVYFHSIRRIYDLHLIDFMMIHYGPHGYKDDVEFHLSQTDNEITAAMRKAARNQDEDGHAPAKALLNRGHFRSVYVYNPSDQRILSAAISEGKIAPEMDKPFNSPAYQLWKPLVGVFGESNLKNDLYIQGSSPAQFPVLMPDGRIESSVSLSRILANFPLMTVDSIYASPLMASAAKTWIQDNRRQILNGLPL